MLKIGDFIPNITLRKHDGTDFSLNQLMGKPSVIYFYPKNNTPKCTAQACMMRDAYEDFVDYGAEVVGISFDKMASHQNFISQKKLPFHLLSDSDKKASKAFGVPKILFGLFTGRVTFVADSQGKIVHIFNSLGKVNLHIDTALEAVKSLSDAK